MAYKGRVPKNTAALHAGNVSLQKGVSLDLSPLSSGDSPQILPSSNEKAALTER